MKAYLSRRYHFSASHRLHVASLPDDVNRGIYGKCNHPHGHGHNYVVEVTFSGPVDQETGMVTNLADLDAFARQHLVERFDLVNLNRMDLFDVTVPTTENLAIAVLDIFRSYPHAQLENVHIEETPNNSFDYAPGLSPAAGMRGRGRPGLSATGLDPSLGFTPGS